MAKTLPMANNANKKFNRSEILRHKMENRTEFSKRHKQTNASNRQRTVSPEHCRTITTNCQSKYEYEPEPGSNSINGCRINCVKNQRLRGLTNQHFWWLMLWLMTLQMPEHVASNQGTTTTTSLSAIKYSQLLSTNGQITMNNDKSMANIDDNIDDDTFRPFVPKDPEMLTHNVFTPSGQFRVFQPIDTDLRIAAALQSKSQHNGKNELTHSLSTASVAETVPTPSSSHAQRAESQKKDQSRRHKTTDTNTTLPHNDKQPETSNLLQQQDQKQQHHQQKQYDQLNTIKKSEIHHAPQQKMDEMRDDKRNEIKKQDMPLDAAADTNVDIATDFKNLEDLLVDYLSNMWEKGQYEPVPGLVVELQNLNETEAMQSTATQANTRITRQIKGVTDAKVHIDVPRTLATGRLLFLTGTQWKYFLIFEFSFNIRFFFSF